MKREKKFFLLWVKVTLVGMSVAFSLQSCSSDPITGELVNMAAKSKVNQWEVPELTKEDSILVDSISQLDDFKVYAKNFQQMIKKTRPIINTLSEKEYEELSNRKDSINGSALMIELRRRVNIEEELQVFSRTSKPFYDLIRNPKLTKSAQIALSVKILTDSIQ